MAPIQQLRSRFSGLGMALLLALSATACGDDHPQSTILPKSDFAEIIHSLYVDIFWWTMVILVVVWVGIAYILVRFRARKGDAKPRQIRGHLGLEIAWTIGPALIVIAIVIPTIQAVFATQRPVSDDAMLVEVTGHRFWWEFHYPEEGVTTANELRLPVDRPVSLRLGSSDVIHSFWVPQLGGKRDVNPTVAVREGQEPSYNWLHFTPLETGVYMGQCAEFCGEAHALMGIRVVVEPQADFDAWVGRWQAGPGQAGPESVAADTPGPSGGEVRLAAQKEGETAEEQVTLGRDIFLNQSTCVACHAVNGTSAEGRVGPDLSLLGTRTTLGAGLLENTPENLVRWIQDPQGIKPGAEMPGTEYALAVPRAGGTIYGWPATGLTDQQVHAVAAYLSSLQ
ncbi:MAG: cytochrome c oxidase subunit II [Gemmatimonadota bacterium]